MKKEWTIYMKLIDPDVAYTGRFYWLNCSDAKRRVYWLGLGIWELRIAYEEGTRV